LPFLFLPNANLNRDFQNCTAFGEVSKVHPRVLVKATHRQHTFVFAMRMNTHHFALGHRSYIFALTITDNTTSHGLATANTNCEYLAGNVQLNVTTDYYLWNATPQMICYPTCSEQTVYMGEVTRRKTFGCT
jgi:NAD-dependent dihydropyrimidine dehydrogenase PreA subunit